MSNADPTRNGAFGARSRRVLVFGATGYIGSHLVPRLVARGHDVRTSARRCDVLEARGWDAEVVAADALRPETLDSAFAGVDVAYYLLPSPAADRASGDAARRAAAHFRRAAERAGTSRIVCLGRLLPEEGDTDGPDAVPAASAARGEVGAILRGGSVPVTELRVGIVIGPGSAPFEVIRDLVRRQRVMATPRWVRSRSRPIALDDLIEYLARVPEVDETANRVLDVAGPEVLTFEEMLRIGAAALGRRVTVIPVPSRAARLSACWLDLVTAVPASVARSLLDTLGADLAADDADARRWVPMALHTYLEAFEAALCAEQEKAVLARWVEGTPDPGRDWADGAYGKQASAWCESTLPVGALWGQVLALGGARGWAYMNWLWWLRGALDRLIGGVGMRRGRRHPTDLRVGDALDFWRVVAVDPGHRLTLLAEMKLPGVAVLEFTLESLPEGRSVLQTTARFRPAGVPGLLYWWALRPIHAVIFEGLARELVQAAERAEPPIAMSAGRSDDCSNGRTAGGGS